MDMKSGKILLVLLVLLSLLLSGCRRRTGGSGQGSAVPGALSGPAGAAQQGNQTPEEVPPGPGAENEPSGSGENEDAGGSRTKENPDASRKEYDEDAPAEVTAGTDHLLHEEGTGSGTAGRDPEAETIADRLNDQAEEPAVQKKAAEEAEQTGVSEDGKKADSSLTYYTVLLQSRAASLFECQRANVYWETEQDHVTVHKTAPEHALILNAGAYDVSARLLPENLRVDDGWVARKNPQVIVKVVDSGVLGSGVSSARAAKSVAQQLARREGWSAIDAVRNARVLLLSREMLEAPWLRTAAEVLIAKTANPELYADVDPGEMLAALAEEATGLQPAGVYYVSGGEE